MQETLKTQSFIRKGATVKALDYITGQWLLAIIDSKEEIGKFTVKLNWVNARAYKTTDLSVSLKMQELPVFRWPIQPLASPDAAAGARQKQPRMRSGCYQYSDTLLGYHKWNCCQGDPVSLFFKCHYR